MVYKNKNVQYNSIWSYLPPPPPLMGNEFDNLRKNILNIKICIWLLSVITISFQFNTFYIEHFMKFTLIYMVLGTYILVLFM